MISKVQSNGQKEKFKNKREKKFNSDNLKKLLENNHHQEPQNDINYDTANSDNDFDMLDDKVASDQIDYNMRKPGAHAKAGEWRKWKMMRILTFYFFY